MFVISFVDVVLYYLFGGTICFTVQCAEWIKRCFFCLHFGKRNCTWKRSCQSAPLCCGVTTLQKACNEVLIGSLSIFIILPTPPPIGTVQRSSLAASQFAVMIGAEVTYQPWGSCS